MTARSTTCTVLTIALASLPACGPSQHPEHRITRRAEPVAPARPNGELALAASRRDHPECAAPTFARWQDHQTAWIDACGVERMYMWYGEANGWWESDTTAALAASASATTTIDGEPAVTEAATAPVAGVAPTPALPDFPTEVAGFRFGAPIDEARRACEGAGHRWEAVRSSWVCSRTPAPIGHQAVAIVHVCNERVCGLSIVIDADGDAPVLRAWTDLRAALEQRYGSGSYRFVGDRSCEDAVARGRYACVSLGNGEIEYAWPTAGDGQVAITMRRNGSVGLGVSLIYIHPWARAAGRGDRRAL